MLASNFITLIPSCLIRQMLANFLELNSKGLYESSRQEKQSSYLVFRPRQNVKLCTFKL